MHRTTTRLVFAAIVCFTAMAVQMEPAEERIIAVPECDTEKKDEKKSVFPDFDTEEKDDKKVVDPDVDTEVKDEKKVVNPDAVSYTHLTLPTIYSV